MQLHTVNPADRAPSIIPLDFYVDYKEAGGKLIEVERVRWTRKGTMGAETSEAVHRLQRDNGPIWQALRPYYDHWKQGKEAPVDGVPLAAWPGATPQLVKALEPFHIRSVEDLAELEDGALSKVPVPGIRSLRDKAKAYVAASSTTAPVARELETLRGENDTLKRELDELKALVASIAEDKPRRGRPPKAEAA